MRSPNTALTETAKALAYERAMQSGWTWQQWELVIGKRRTQEAVRLRHELMDFLHKRGFPLTVIAGVFNRDHSTVFTAISWRRLPDPNMCEGYHSSEVGALL